MLVIPYTEEQLQKFTLPLSDSEEHKCAATIALVKRVLSDAGYSFKSENFKNPRAILEGYTAGFSGNDHNISVLVQGSYSNNTCVRGDSDVDIAIIIDEPFKTKYPDGADNSTYGFSSTSFDILGFKSRIASLFDKTLTVSVQSKNKSILIGGNSQIKKADIVSCQRLRNYRACNSYEEKRFIPGIAITTNDGSIIYNYPEIHQRNDIEKNVRTDGWYKRIVRVFKNIAYDLKEQNIFGKELSSFVIECMLYNVDDFYYKNDMMHFGTVKDRILCICNWLEQHFDDFNKFVEVNGLNYLFTNSNNRDPYVFQNFIYAVKTRLPQ